VPPGALQAINMGPVNRSRWRAAVIAARGRAARSSLTTLHRSSGRRVAGWNRESSTALAGRVFASGVRHHRSSEAAVLEGGDGGDPAYHHFPNKLELFAAVYEQEQQRLAELFIAAHSTRSDDQDGLEGGFRAFLEASRDPGVQRITLLDAPSVLGWERLRVIEDRYTIAMLRVALEQAVATGVFDDRPVEPLVQMLNGALRKEALLIARSENQEEVTEQVLLELRVWFGVLRKRTQLI
jgi:hypothetical protein